MLKTTAAAGSAAIVSWFGPRTALAEPDSPLPPPVTPGAYAYFTQPEIAFLDAALSRLIPADALGPGAKEAGVTFFIDQQMAGPFGRAETWYMQGPWKDGTDEQGYQLKLTPAQLYRVGIEGTDDYCRRTFNKKNFAQLGAADQDKVLHGLEKGEIELSGAPAKEFFSMLWQNTGEGFFADPIYGGNRDFAGWKLLGFPGPRYNYVNEIEQYGKPYTLPTVGLMGRNGSPARKG
jgi:gluconate 2-dehydrogenase gamma chain